MRTRLRRSPTVADIASRLSPGVQVAIVRDGSETVIALDPSTTIAATAQDAFTALDRMTEGWWAGFISYDLGRAVERIPDKNPKLPLPDVRFTRFDTRIVLADDGSVRIEGRPETLDELLDAPPREQPQSELSDWVSSLGREDYRVALAAIREHLLAGNCYQVNFTRTLTASAEADPIALYLDVSENNPAPHQALIVSGDAAIVSASPESFLRVEGPRVATRPIKGTSVHAGRLRSSEKDRAENVMIVDLARNDFGRVCEYGSVRVRELCALEAHPGLYHLVSTVDGTLCADVSLGHLIRATFPPASVTGCPKPRVLQIIEELEPVRRGVYCGALGFVDAERAVCDFNVAIRTFAIADGRTSFGVGGGIVADSDPDAEWEETELKARRLLRIASGDDGF